jgi:formylglycine-generating enzyme required for sulfatase activity
MSETPKAMSAEQENAGATPPEGDLDSLPAPTFREALPNLAKPAATVRPSFPGYEILGELGQGGMGVVLLAKDLVLGRQVAIKVMRPELPADDNARQRFLREARAAAALDHQHIVPIHQVGEENSVPFIVMPVLKGETLENRLKREKRLPVADAVTIGKQIALGLAEAHRNGLMHRDIKPANIWLQTSSDGGGARGEDNLSPSVLATRSSLLATHVRIADFGLAAVAGDDAHLTKTGTVMGTPAYMAPEQARSEKVDFRCDLFSLGAVLYRMLTADLPFKGRDTMSLLMSLAADTPAPLESLNPDVPPALADLVMQLLAKEPSQRPPSAEAVAEALGAFAAGGAERGQAPFSASAGDLQVPKMVPDPLPPPLTKKTGLLAIRRSGVTLAVAGVVLTVLLATILLPHLTRTEDGPANSADVKGLPKEFTNSLHMKLILIPAGKFTMGSSRQEIDHWKALHARDADWVAVFEAEGPEHEVEITRPFYMGTTEVTVGQFRQFVNEKAYPVGDDRWANPGFAQSDDHAVGWLTWQNAVNFCTWLSQKEGKTYRLPTEAEWEYSCRTGKTGLRYSFGNSDADLLLYAWYGRNSQAKAQPVGKLPANAWGLFDMHGNIWEWCQDIYDPNYYQASPKQDPAGPPDGTERVLRGGAFQAHVWHCRSAFRYHLDAARRIGYCGFRVVCEIPAK